MLRAVLWCAVSTKEQTNDDKYSLPTQESDQRALCEREGWQIVAVLTVPGHSRHYIDIHELAEDARAAGIDAFDRILTLWQRRAFDVLICRDGDRFARTQSLHAYFVERTIEIDARIYSLADGWIDERNARMWTAMGGYKAASHVDGLVEARRRGMDKRMERGLNGGPKIPDPYRVVRDDNTGKPLRLDFRPEYRQIMDDAATLLLEGLPWRRFGPELYRRFGHVNPHTGQPYHDNCFRGWFHNPIIWGITAKGYTDKYGLWAFDENEPLPDGVKVERHPAATVPAIPAAWTGEIADRIKAELRRRAAVVKGRAVSQTQFAFTGLLVCAVCGWRFSADAGDKSKRRQVYWKCPKHTNRDRLMGQVCANTKRLRDDRARTQINAILADVLAQREFDISTLTSNNTERDRQRQQATQWRGETERLRRQIDTLIGDQSTAPANIHDSYTRRIEQASQRLADLERNLQRAESTLESAEVRQLRQRTYTELKGMGLDALWQRPPHEINQILHALMGRYRFVVQDGVIVDVR